MLGCCASKISSRGNATPIARSADTLYPAFQLASDSTGENLIEAHYTNYPAIIDVGIATLAKQFASDAAPGILFNIDGMIALGVADDPTTKTYLVTTPTAYFGSTCRETACGIYRLAENTAGHDTLGPGDYPRDLKPAPVSIITSDACGSQLALGYARDIYVTHGTQSGCPTDAVYVYRHDSAGNVPPLPSLSGPATRLNKPYGLYEGR